MINVLKRLAELDATNPNVVKSLEDATLINPQPMVAESGIGECGMMPEMGLPGAIPSQPHTPASINMTAASGDELSGMLRDIMTLAGRGEQAMPTSSPAMALEPAAAPSREPTDIMRSVLDKMNAVDSDDEITGLDQDGDGDHDMGDHDMEKDEGVYTDPDGDEDPADAADQADDERRRGEEELGEYDNTPADPNKKNEFDANQFAKNDNTPGQGDRMDGDRPKAFPTMEQIEKSLFSEYQRFIREN